MEIIEVSRTKLKTCSLTEREEKLKKMRKEYNVLVKGKFEFLDAQSGWFEFSHRFFPEDLLVNYRFIHSEICEIPKGLAKHLNNTVKKIRNPGKDVGSERGNEISMKGKIPSSISTTSRVRFTSVDFF